MLVTRWRRGCPAYFRSLLVEPVRFERYTDELAHAEKLLGFDAEGERCFYRHRYALLEGRFDQDDMPWSLLLYGEEVTAWRLRDGDWLKAEERAGVQCRENPSRQISVQPDFPLP